MLVCAHPSRVALPMGRSFFALPCSKNGHVISWKPTASMLIRRRQSMLVRSIWPDDCSDENNSDASGEQDTTTGSVSIDLKSLQGASRRSMLVGFTCDACGGRTERLVNPLAWAKGMVIVQCEHCNAWHKIADANNMVEEYRFDCSDDE